MNFQHTRRDFLKTAASTAVALCAAGAVGTPPATMPATGSTTGPLASEPIQRVGGSSLKISLNAYSFSKLLNDRNKHRGPGTSLMELLDFCAKNNFDGFDPTGYFFPTYPE